MMSAACETRKVVDGHAAVADSTLLGGVLVDKGAVSPRRERRRNTPRSRTRTGIEARERRRRARAAPVCASIVAR
jgi:hypothetical protein